jgi:uncharacterized repeat protein (TIGR03803 family)
MKNSPQQRDWISGMRLAAAGAVLAIVPPLVLADITPESAQPQISFTTLHSFDGTDGYSPTAPLVQATDGDLYGTTEGTGLGPANGTVFKITPTGTLTNLYSFCSLSGCTDGELPYAGLVQATDGDFYATTFAGGTYGHGTVFKITQSGTVTTLYNFCPSGGFCSDGNQALAGLVQATNGNFYGTTLEGGADGPYGTVFKITTSGTLTTLHSFCSQSNCTDGEAPQQGNLIQATDGNLYGTTFVGGTYNYGTIFKISTSGSLTTLHSFDLTDGGDPRGGLVQASDGNFYGTAFFGGAHGEGTVFKITPNGALTTLHSFCRVCPNGYDPTAGLVQATNGTFYGTTPEGGADGDGTVFSLSVGLGPFVETQTTSGKVGAAVKILGTNLTGATSVTFNGTAAKFTVISKSEIFTIVPIGATSGTVEVTIPRGTLKSNTRFRVTP